MLIGDEALEKLRNSRVAVFGVGGVGGYAAEALARSGVGAIDLIDSDEIAESNLNRQIVALTSTVGQGKAETAAARIADIDPSIRVTVHKLFFLPEQHGDLDFGEFDYIVDAVDTVAAKLEIIRCAAEAGVPMISAMGCGNRLDPSKLRICDINKTFNDPLAKVVRRKLKDIGVSKLDVVFSEELPVKLGIPTGSGNSLADGAAAAPASDVAEKIARGSAKLAENGPATGKRSPASMIFVPACAGLMMAGYVCRKLAGI